MKLKYNPLEILYDYLDVLDRSLVNVEDKTVPIISALKALLSKIK